MNKLGKQFNTEQFTVESMMCAVSCSCTCHTYCQCKTTSDYYVDGVIILTSTAKSSTNESLEWQIQALA